MANLGSILVVEDNPDWRKKLKVILERERYEVQTAASYGEALGELRRKPFHLVVVDLSLSPSDAENRDGMALLGDVLDRGIPIMIVTGYGTPALAQKAYEAGVLSFLDKASFDATEFRKLVRQAIVSKEKGQIEEELTLEQKKRFQELTRKLFRGEMITSE